MTKFSNHISDCLLWKDSDTYQRPKATFKETPDDFIVNEILDWNFQGQGEHIFLQIEKTGCNTAWVAKQLAKFYGVPPRDVSYSGMKDRHAVTTQYFSIRLPGVKPESYQLPEHDEYRVISHQLHHRKLKRGNHKYNDFVIRLKNVAFYDETHVNAIEERLAYIRDNGCPNFFDTQRFGRDNNNLSRLSQWIAGDIELRKRDEKSIVLSALRSSIFNQQLAARIAHHTWNKIIAGDTVILDGTHSHFVADVIDDAIVLRALEKDIHPAGILVGENSEFSEKTEMLATLMRREHVREDYRSMRLHVLNFSWKRDDNDYIVSMRLPTGAYASGVIKQVFDIE